MGPVLNDQICFALYSTSNSITQAYRELLHPLRLTYPQFVVMMALWEQDNVSISTLANRIGLSKSTMTPLLKRLQSSGYINRGYKEDDEREKQIQLTESGVAIAQTAKNITQQAFCATGLTCNEAEQLIAMCQKLKSNLTHIE
ncbi:MarR family winged helix-turn-helix transcriptional regulator [Aliikangiella maris]|uniref:MarR family transcriptional regulator n=2 Tax=Aliikangiella maris TaxID=3162458 RepID=A0ABV3MJM8_9GAMM